MLIESVINDQWFSGNRATNNKIIFLITIILKIRGSQIQLPRLNPIGTRL